MTPPQPQNKPFGLFLSTAEYHSLLSFHSPSPTKTHSNLNITHKDSPPPPTLQSSTKTSITAKDNCFMPHSLLVFLNPQHPKFMSSTKGFIAHTKYSRTWAQVYVGFSQPNLVTIWKTNKSQKKLNKGERKSLKRKQISAREEWRREERADLTNPEKESKWKQQERECQGIKLKLKL